MIIPLSEILKFKPKAGAEDIGVLNDLYLDDRHWHVRYFLANATAWLKAEHEVLLYILDLESISRPERTLTFRVTRDQIAQCPSCGVARPVCGNLISTMHEFYQWPRYWETEAGLEGPLLHYATQTSPPICPSADKPAEGTPGLRSGQELIRFHVVSEGQRIGDICDLLIDLGEWTIRYLVVRLQDDHKQVVLSPRLINQVDGASQSVSIDFSERMLRHSPCYNRSAPIMMTYDDGVTDYYYFSAKWLLNYNPNLLMSYNDYLLLKK